MGDHNGVQYMLDEYGSRVPLIPGVTYGENDANGYLSVSALHQQEYSYYPQQQATRAGAHQPQLLASPLNVLSIPDIAAKTKARRTMGNTTTTAAAPSTPVTWHQICGIYVRTLYEDGVDYALLIPRSIFVYYTTVIGSRTGDSVSLFRKRIAEYSGGLTHIELAFAFDRRDTHTREDPLWSCSSASGVPVNILERKITGDAYNPEMGEWKSSELMVTAEQRQRAWVFSQSQCEKPYNKWGVWAFLPYMRCLLTCFCGSIADGSTMFCSQLVIETLRFTFAYDHQRLAILNEKNSWESTPADTLSVIQRMQIMSKVADTAIDPSIMMEALNRRLLLDDAAEQQRAKFT